jgi:lipoic acid synthetase
MLGLGEFPEELRQVFRDLVEVDCRVLTLGQYLQPSANHLPVVRFVPPEEFKQWRQLALDTGLTEVVSGPLVRSSYCAGELYEALRM